MKKYEYIYETTGLLHCREYIEEENRSVLTTIPKDSYAPSLYIPSKEGNYYSHATGKPLSERKFQSVSDMKSFIKENEDLFVIHGNTSVPQNYIRTHYPNPLESEHTFRTHFIDIETRSVNGFSDGEEANEQISLIQFYDNFDRVFYILGYNRDYENNYNSSWGEVKYFKYDSEKEMLKAYVKFVRDLDPAILVGFNSYGFDFPYIINRLKKVKIRPELLSPVDTIKSREKINSDNISYIHYDIVGRILLDYRELYRKYTFTKLPRYSLEAISNFELGEGKIQHDEYDSWEKFYLEDYQKFCDYAIRDIEVLILLDDKIKLIDTAKYIAYLCGVNIPDVMGTIKQWNSYMFNGALKLRNEILPLNQQYAVESDVFPGGWIGATLGLYKKIAVFDFEGLYPATIRALNIGVDTLVKPHEMPQELIDLREKYFSWYNEKNFAKLKRDNAHLDEHYNLMNIINNKEEINAVLVKYNVTASPNGYFYKRDKEGLFPALLKSNTVKRNEGKEAMKDAEKKIKELELLISQKKSKLSV